MLQDQRATIILHLLRHQGSITTDDVCVNCGCSPITARRDLARLEEQGSLRRIHGGATLPPSAEISSESFFSSASALETRLAVVDRADVLVVSHMLDTVDSRRVVTRCQRAGVPVIADTLRFPGATTLVGVDDYRAGLELGRYAREYAQRHLGGRACVLDISSSLSNTQARSRGFAAGVWETSRDCGSLVRVLNQHSPEVAYQAAADTLALAPDVNVIVGVNSWSAAAGLKAFLDAGRDPKRLLLCSFGLETDQALDEMYEAGPTRAAMILLPEIVGRTCVDAAVCAFHHCPLPERLITPTFLVTPQSLDCYYSKDPQTSTWQLDGSAARRPLSSSTGVHHLTECHDPRRPRRIGLINGSLPMGMGWQLRVQEYMLQRCRELGIALEVIDSGQDLRAELSVLRRQIGRAAAALVDTGDTIIIEAGPSAIFMAEGLRGRRDITVVTNSVPVLSQLAGEEGLTVISCGGVAQPGDLALTGPGAEASFSQLRADKAFISGQGLSIEFGLSDARVAEGAVTLAMVAAVREVIALVEHPQIGIEALHRVVATDRIHRVVTDAGVDSHDRQALTQRAVDVIIAEEVERINGPWPVSNARTSS